MSRSKIFAALAIALVGAAATPVYAAAASTNDAQAIDNAGISLPQAVSKAVQHTPGKVSRAELERTNSGWVYIVEVVNGKQVTDVKINAQDGSVIAATPDHIDDSDQLHEDHDKKNAEDDA